MPDSPTDATRNTHGSEATYEQQRSLISALLHADVYPHSVDNIQLIETHISWVILTGSYAYKIKKNVNFGFLDFSTLEKRQKFCEEEIRLNSRLAPSIYLNVVPIHGPIKGASIGGTGEIIEYAVRMLQFNLHNGFDALLDRNELTTSHMEETAQVLAQFHTGIAIANETSPFGTPAAIRQPAIENFDQLAEALGPVANQHELIKSIERLRQWTTVNHTLLTPVFIARKNAGFVRECHGDLHLRNIVLWEGKVTPFDGVEFNDNLRWIDVISELAFLLMDLDATNNSDHKQPALARQFLNSYLSATGDYEGLQVLRYYQIYRAMVRAKVAGLRLTQNEKELSHHLQEIHSYLTLAEQYTQPQSPKLIITHGLSGSGKTVISKKISLATDLIHLRSDVERKRYFGFSENAKTQSDPNAGIYSQESTDDIYSHLLEQSKKLLSAGYSVLVDATFLQRQQRNLFRSLAHELATPFIILYCTAENETLQQRVQLREKEGKDASEATEAVLITQQQNQEPLNADEKPYSHSINTIKETDINNILSLINSA